MGLSQKQYALLAVIKKSLAWSDEIYRDVLVTIGGVTSATELSREGFDAIIAYADYSGFRPLESKTPRYGMRAGFATYAQLSLIRELWREIHRQTECDDAHLLAWLSKYHKVDSLRFMKTATGQKVITTLKAWKARERSKAA